MFLDDTACNLASLNLLAFPTRGRQLRGRGFQHAVRLWTIVLEISVMMAQFPSKEIARLSYDYRTLGLGYANLGGLLMASGIPYDSDAGRAICAAITALMTGTSYATSAEMAGGTRAVPALRENATECCASSATIAAPLTARRRDTRGWRSRRCRSTPPPARIRSDRACRSRHGTMALSSGEAHGFRNAQV